MRTLYSISIAFKKQTSKALTHYRPISNDKFQEYYFRFTLTKKLGRVIYFLEYFFFREISVIFLFELRKDRP